MNAHHIPKGYRAAVDLKPFASGPVRELSHFERCRWARCPRCNATHGDPCEGIEVFIGDGGAHTERLERAPFKVREVPVQT